jgi:hypothetical protein
MSEYGADFDRLAAEWRTIENAHDREHPDRNECGGVGGCTMMRVANRLEQDMIEVLDAWRVATPPASATRHAGTVHS